MSGRPPILDEVELALDGQGVSTFPNGTAWEYWADRNCLACRWYDAEEAGASCAFEGAALLGMVTPELARLFGWVQDLMWDRPDDHTDGWSAPVDCPFRMGKRLGDDDGDDPRPDPPRVDPGQLTFLAPGLWPTTPAPVLAEVQP